MESSHPRSLRRLLLAAAAIVAASALVLLVARYARELWTVEAPPMLADKQPLPAEPHPDPIHMKATPISGIDSRHVIDRNFRVVTRMAEISEPCRGIFQSSFVNLSGSPTREGQVAIADPEQDFEATDAIRGGLPFRRLVFAGLGSEGCFLYFERGGAMYPSSCLAVIDYANRKAIWIGAARKRVSSLQELRSLVSRGDFHDDGGPAC